MEIDGLAMVFGAALGAGLGFFGGLFGIGGGIIAVPVFVLAFGMSQPLAQGTALVLMVPNLLVAWWRYQQRHPVPLAAVGAIAVSACATTWAVAQVAVGIDPAWLRLIFSGFLLLLALRLGLFGGRKTGGAVSAADEPLPPLPRLALIGALGGSSMGLLGIGGGLIATPLLVGWLRQRQTVAQSLALALVAPSSVIALGTYAGAGRVQWAVGLPMALGGLFTVSAGVALAHRLPEARMRKAFAGLLTMTALWLMIGPYVLGGGAGR